jgi:hypothetical protein
MLCLLGALLLQAQTARCGAPAGFRILALFGVMQPEVSDLNAALRRAGFPAVSASPATIGLGAEFAGNRWLLGLEGLAALTDTSRSGEATLSYGSAHILTSVGYAFPAGRSLHLVPRFLFGAGGSTLRISPRGDYSFTEALAHPGREIVLNNRYGLCGVSASLLYRGPRNSRARGGSIIELRIGYLARLTDGNSWESAAATVPGGPRVSSAGPFLQFAVGGEFLSRPR